MSKVKFGTDGVRGRVNSTLLVSDVLHLGMGHGYSLRAAHEGRSRPFVVVGRDSRVSGEALLGAYSAGLMSHGVDVVDLGVLPTPAIAYAAKTLAAQGAAMLSASHNPVPDNGIKLFGAGGKKLTDLQARELESLISKAPSLETVDGIGVGRFKAVEGYPQSYYEFLLSNLEGRLEGLSVVLDCANGAAAGHALILFREAGAKVVAINDVCDGEKINVNCGSTDLSPLKAAVQSHSADLGLAFDGDADRCLAVTAQGQEVSGDQMMVLIADHLKSQGRLTNDSVILTVMSNLGAELALKDKGIQVTRTAVGDRYVFEEMERTGAVLGGEQSGHVLLLDRHWSGDGILAGLVLSGILAKSPKTLDELIAEIPEMPQKLVNVGGVDKTRINSDAKVQEAIKVAEDRLGSEGRLLVRPSGTESLVRLMAEGPDLEALEDILADLREVVVAELTI